MVGTWGAMWNANNYRGSSWGTTLSNNRNERQTRIGMERQNESDTFANAQWDPNTFMPNTMTAPPAAQAANYDWQSQRLYQEAKNRYFQEALGASDQALSTLGGYRAGGAAGAASQIIQNRGSMAFNIANSLERPDMFANARTAAAQAAQDASKKAGQMALLGGAIQAGATIVGGVVGGPAGAMAGMAAGGAANQAIQGSSRESASRLAGESRGYTGTTSGAGGGGIMQPLPSGPGTGSGAEYPGGPGGGVQTPSKMGGGGGAAGAAGGQQPQVDPAFQDGMLQLQASIAVRDEDFMRKANQSAGHYLRPIPEAA